jgi:hypothetical protein
MIVVRYADDTIIGFEHQQDAERFLADLSARLAEFGLGLHPDKTRLIEFGRNAIANHRSRGLGKPKTFDFLGFTHYCADVEGDRKAEPAAAFVLVARGIEPEKRCKPQHRVIECATPLPQTGVATPSPVMPASRTAFDKRYFRFH